MCGIAGFLTDTPADPALVRRMCEAIVHRGPDDEGYFVDGGLALGMRRLSIIDLQTGQQPIWNEDGSVVIVFNGEIYNFRELRSQLIARGHRFSTDGDTECIVHLYEDEGDRFVERLRGMFAFALWDTKRRRLVLARDRVGKKPLFYRLTNGGIAFASELKSLIQDPSCQRAVDPVALHHYLTYQYVPAPWTIYEGIKKLPPASVLVFETGRARIDRYWSLDYSPKFDMSEDDAIEQLRLLLLDSVKLRLISDRPIGAFLSGGVDSALVVAAMAAQSTGRVKTFTVGFNEPGWDERAVARQTAQRFDTEHHELVVTPSAVEILPELVWHYDEPFADPSAIPSLYLARMTSGHVTVALNGDGADESFAGYQRYLAHELARRATLPSPLRRLAGVGAGALPKGASGSRTRLRRAQRVLQMLSVEPGDRYAHMMSYFRPEEKLSTYTPEMRDLVGGIDSYDLLRTAGSKGPRSVDEMLSADVSTYLPGDLLVKMDIATMASSLEARSPFLDHNIMEFAARLPANMKLRGRRSKYLLKRLGRGWIPDAPIDRPKSGFGVPIASWLRAELAPLLSDALCDSVARSRGYFEPAAITKLISEHQRGHDHSTRLWALFQFELWHRMFIDSGSMIAPTSSSRTLGQLRQRTAGPSFGNDT